MSDHELPGMWEHADFSGGMTDATSSDGVDTGITTATATEPQRSDLRVVYLIEDEPYAGSLQDYADALANGYYSGVSVSNRVWVHVKCELVARRPNLTATPFDQNDYSDVMVEVDGVTAGYRIDGRA